MRIQPTVIRKMIRSDNKRSSVLFQNGINNGGTVEEIDKSFKADFQSVLRTLESLFMFLWLSA